MAPPQKKEKKTENWAKDTKREFIQFPSLSLTHTQTHEKNTNTINQSFEEKSALLLIKENVNEHDAMILFSVLNYQSLKNKQTNKRDNIQRI